MADQPRLLQRPGEGGCRRPAYAQHLGEELLPQREGVAVAPIVDHQQRARALLLQRVDFVASDALENLAEERLA